MLLWILGICVTFGIGCIVANAVLWRRKHFKRSRGAPPSPTRSARLRPGGAVRAPGEVGKFYEATEGTGTARYLMPSLSIR